jgi:hypothetical protein
MKTINDDQRFDRLVDGELSEQERRELLAGLDDEPGGWRRCALAFLESQCWKQAFGMMTQARAPITPQTKAARPRQARWTGHLGTVLAMAACFLIAFWVGSALHQTGHGQLSVPSAPSGELADAHRSVTLPVTKASDRSLASVAGANPWRMVTVAAPSDVANAGSAIHLPAVERDNIDPEWVRSVPSAIPDNVMRALSRTGHQVEQHRDLFPVPLDDGRQLVVPVDRVNVHYVGNGTY